MCPLVSTNAGLDYVSEYDDPNEIYEPGYLCTLCQVRMNPRQAVKHAIGDRHNVAYMVGVRACGPVCTPNVSCSKNITRRWR